MPAFSGTVWVCRYKWQEWCWSLLSSGHYCSSRGRAQAFAALASADTQTCRFNQDTEETETSCSIANSCWREARLSAHLAFSILEFVYKVAFKCFNPMAYRELKENKLKNKFKWLRNSWISWMKWATAGVLYLLKSLSGFNGWIDWHYE